MLKPKRLFLLALAVVLIASVSGCDLLSDDESNDGSSNDDSTGGSTEVQVTVAENNTYGTYLTDAEGNSLYLFTDGNGNPVSCTDDCADAWPPFTVEGEVTGSEDVNSSLLSTTERADGSSQVVYNGWPLYYFVNDQSPGDVNGQGITSFGGTWYLVSPAGDKIENGSNGSGEEAQDDYDHTGRISEFQVSGDNSNRADPSSEQVLLRIDEPQFNHNGGTLAFGPDDGYLYISLGDGGGANDTGTGHVEDWYDANEGGNGQDVTQNLLGNILRIDVDSGDPYGIPSDNPFADSEGRDEIYSYGFRNPYRFSFDMGGDHDLFVGDVGQDRWEEVDIVTNGGNYGWNVREGAHCFDAANPGQPFTGDCPTTDDEGDPLISPIIEYPNASYEAVADTSEHVGLSVVGGFVYRGSDFSDFESRYVFGDYSSSFSVPNGQLFIAETQQDGLWDFDKLHVAESSDAETSSEGNLNHFLLGIGQDLDGELYVLTSDSTGPTGSTGKVFKMVPPEDTTPVEPAAVPETDPSLAENAPNPFRTATVIRFSLPHSQHATLTAYDVLGRKVAVLADRTYPAGTHRVRFEAPDLPGGVYFYTLIVDGEQKGTGSMMKIE